MSTPLADTVMSPPYWPYLAAAAVLTSFDADTLRPLDGGPIDDDLVAEMLLDCAEPVKAGPAQGRWRLRDDMRGRVLARLGSRERIWNALRANASDARIDPAARMLTALVENSSLASLDGRSLQDLLAMDLAVQWLEQTDVRPLPQRTEIRARIEREKLLEPFRRLCVGFRGRDDDLTALRSYVDTLPSTTMGEAFSRFSQRLLNRVFSENPPFFLWGPGGAGKSTLVGKFILDHAGSEPTRPMAFVLLDFDRVTLDPTRPDTLLTEIIAQLTVQLMVQAPDEAWRLTDLQQGVVTSLASQESFTPERSSRDSTTLRAELCDVLRYIAYVTNQHVLFVVDTFEVVQRRGATAVFGVIELIVTLMAAVKPLRVVMIGRSELRDRDFYFTERVPKLKAHFLGGFDAESGRAYLKARLEPFGIRGVSDADLDRIVVQVRGNPLGLRLAAAVFRREGLRGIEDAVGRQQLQEAIAEEQLQGMLHQRIVSQLEGDVAKIANPGLIVRRLTAAVIREVLAGPCKLDLTINSPEGLLSSLRGEGSLFEDVDANTVRHRPDVRLIMLPSLRRELGPLAREIDDTAVTYWSTQPGPAARAEEIYHRLWRGDSESDLNRRWLPGAEQALEDAADEFASAAPSDEARIWLAEKLKRELPSEIRQRASQRAWERDIEVKARRLLDENLPDEALKVLHERHPAERVPASALWLTEIDIYLVKKDNESARATIDLAMKALGEAIDARYTVHLLTRQVTVIEREGHVDDALVAAQRAFSLTETMRDPVMTFACGVTLCRVRRKLRRGDDETQALIIRLAALADERAVREALKERPALLREAAAELGVRAPWLMSEALVRLGLETLAPEGDLLVLPPEVEELLSNAVGPTVPGRRTQGQLMAESLAKFLLDAKIRGRDATLSSFAQLFQDSVERYLK